MICRNVADLLDERNFFRHCPNSEHLPSESGNMHHAYN